jgi:hypothetical protein
MPRIVLLGGRSWARVLLHLSSESWAGPPCRTPAFLVGVSLAALFLILLARPSPSTLLLLKRRVQPLELYARILRSEAPLDLDVRSIAPILPGRGFPFEGLEVRHPPLKALAA